MTVAEQEKETVEQKIAKSSGNETEKYSKQLEDDVDKLITEVYHQDKVKEENPAEEKEPVKQEKEEEEEIESLEVNEKNITISEDDDLETLKEKLSKSEERRKNTQSEFSKREQAERDKEKVYNATIEALKDTIASLKNTADTPSVTKTQEAAKDKDIKAGLGELGEQFKTLENIDPDIAKPLKTLFEGMSDQINGLQTKLRSTTEAFSKTAATNDEEIHFAKIERAHNDYEDLIETDAFKSWIDSLPGYVQKVANSDLEEGTAEDIIELISDYKRSIRDPEKEKKIEREKKVKLAQGLINPGTDGSKEIKGDDATPVKYTRKMLKAMSPKEFAEKEADIDYHASIGNIPDE